jgi:hypothetical protein
MTSHAGASIGSWRRPTFGAPLAVFQAVVLTALVGVLVAGDSFRLALALTMTVLVAGLGFVAPRALLYGLVVWLAALGLIRRVTASVEPAGGADVLLLVGPAALAVLAALALRAGALRHRTRLSTAVLALSGLIVVSALNPLQGSLVTGFAGLLFLFVPTLAFWVGRGLVDDTTLARVLKTMAAIAIPVAFYGFLQTLSHFPSWDTQWIQSVRFDYTALNIEVAGNIRPFSTFSSATEYGYYLGIGIVVWLALGLTRARLLVSAPIAVFLAIALIYESSRQVVFALALVTGLLFAAWRRFSFLTAAVAAACLVVSLPFLVRLVPAPGGADRASLLISHQIQGVANPADAKSSTLPVHLSLVENGLRSAFEEPLGVGVGAVTLAGSKFADVQRDTEADISNVAVALGLPGLLVYIFVLVTGFASAYRTVLERRDPLSFAALGLLALTGLHWLSGGHYAIAFLPWLILGWFDRLRAERRSVLTNTIEHGERRTTTRASAVPAGGRRDGER